MNRYVLKRKEDGAYVAEPGSRESYTRSLERARKFKSYDDAQREACGNETPRSVDSILGY